MMFRRLFLTVAALVSISMLAGLAARAEEEMPKPKGMVLLTVGGLVGKPNRVPLDPNQDNLLAQLNADFKDGFEFDREMLLALPQGTVTAPQGIYKGPKLREVLRYIGAAKVKVRFVGADGYIGYLLPEDIDAFDYILALEGDGKPLGLHGKGPIWLMHNSASPGFTTGSENRGDHVHGVVYMHIGE